MYLKNLQRIKSQIDGLSRFGAKAPQVIHFDVSYQRKNVPEIKRSPNS